MGRADCRGLLVIAGIGAIVVAGLLRGLPDTPTLAHYTPPLPSTVRAGDGTVLTSYSRERRVFLPYKDLPPQLIHAYMSAEDKTFFEHSGLDFAGILRAVVTNVESIGSGRRPVGASTITQQVAKNLLLNNEVSYARKLREAVLARRLEQAFTKQQISNCISNQIFLGRNSYGVEAAAQSYFGKSVAQPRSRADRSILRSCPRRRPIIIRSATTTARWRGATGCWGR